MKINRQFILTLVSVVAAALSVPAVASAGTATIYQCRTASAPADVDLVRVTGDVSIGTSLSDCATPGAWMLSSAGAGLDFTQPRDRTMTFTAPGNTTFVGGVVKRQMNNYPYVLGPGGDTSYGFGYVMTNGFGEVVEYCGHAGAAPTLGSCSPSFSTFSGAVSTFASGQKALPTTATTTYALTVGCAQTFKCYHYIANPGLVGISAALRVRDDVAPVATSVTGPLATAAKIGLGDEAVDIAATDTGGLGVLAAELLVDGTTVEHEAFTPGSSTCVDADTSNADAYEYASGHPCPESVSATRFSAGSLPEGTHNVKALVLDASGNATVVLNRTVEIDRFPAPSATSAPVWSGVAAEGQTLNAAPGTWDAHGTAGLVLGYQWQRCGADGEGCTDVPGATGSTYGVTAADVGLRLRVLVSGTTAEGAALARSQATPTVTARSAGTPAPATPTTPATPGSGDAAPSPAASPSLVTEPDARPAGSPNGTNATAAAKLTAFDAATSERTIRTRYGRQVTISGRLLTPAGKAIAGARLEVHEQELRPGASFVRRGEILSDADGRFTYVAPAGASRMVRIGYRHHVGDETFVRTSDVTVKVVAGVRFAVSAKQLRNGQTLRYSGRILGPSTGHRFVEVQVRSGKTWQIVCSVRTDAAGAFACAHRFRRTQVRTTYLFRARVRAQTGLPYEASASTTKRTTVRPG